jgi:DNA repair exonuclease SbcCD ATPase subunit
MVVQTGMFGELSNGKIYSVWSLRSRGVTRLLRSNGSGKTSLAMSMLWAFTGSIDPRPLQDSKVTDVVNDASKV